MADETPTTPPATGETTPPATPPAAPTEQKPEDTLGDAGKRALDAEREARKAAEKAAREAQAKVKQYEDAGKSELEKAQTTAADAAKDAETARGELARLRAALKAGLDPELADRLKGSTPDELAADAASLAEKFGKAATGSATPPGSFDGGAQPPTPKKSLSEQIGEATAKGDWETVNKLNAQMLMELQG